MFVAQINQFVSFLSFFFFLTFGSLFLCLAFLGFFSLPFSAPKSLPIHPEVPQLTDLSFEDVSDTTISLRWTPFDTKAITGYRITVVAAGESVPIFEDQVLPTTGQYTVYGLEPGIDYDISVTTLTENGESEPTTLTQQTCKSRVSTKLN